MFAKEQCANAACVVQQFQDERETTAGSAGQPFMLDLGKSMMIMIGAKREIFPDGSRFEGVGIKPDVEVEPKAAYLQQGRDTVLEAAKKERAQ